MLSTPILAFFDNTTKINNPKDNDKMDQDYPLFREIQHLIYHRFNAMSEICDQLVEVTILRHFKPTVIMEIGTGNGGWVSLMETMCRDGLLRHYMLLDDFSWINNESTRHHVEKHQLPENVNELGRMLEGVLWSFDIINQTIDDYIKEDPETKIDLVRIDCEPKSVSHWQEIVEWIDRNGSDRLIVLCDDIKPNVALHRLLLMQQLVAEGKLRLFWIGNDAAAWCRPGLFDDLPEWQAYLKSHRDIEILDTASTEMPLHGYPNRIFITRKTKLYDQLTIGSGLAC